MRLFVALDLPEEEKDRLGRLCHGLPGARWTSPLQLHLTLRFIGEVEGGLFLDIREGLAAIEADPLSLCFDGVGCFPPRGKPRVIWAGLRKNDSLLILRNRVESCLVGLGLEPEGRKFSPHITLARLKKTPASRVGRFLEHNALLSGSPFTVSEFHLYSSVLGRNGAVHRREASYSLAD